ncbi:hypothetical protein GCM10009733_006890 [Nonomuraea maheshkhaliensis]|uniref:Uncharacterized protein n=1 Tax=Nonomuraea maheshkhaliensis TaxID=419590 RepID=A0ABN2EQR4_9ACTN
MGESRMGCHVYENCGDHISVQETLDRVTEEAERDPERTARRPHRKVSRGERNSGETAGKQQTR